MAKYIRIRITDSKISKEGFLIKKALVLDASGNVIRNATVNENFAICMKNTDLDLEIPESEPIEFSDEHIDKQNKLDI